MKSCIGCGNEFYPKNSKQRFCSFECREIVSDALRGYPPRLREGLMKSSTDATTTAYFALGRICPPLTGLEKQLQEEMKTRCEVAGWRRYFWESAARGMGDLLRDLDAANFLQVVHERLMTWARHGEGPPCIEIKRHGFLFGRADLEAFKAKARDRLFWSEAERACSMTYAPKRCKQCSFEYIPRRGLLHFCSFECELRFYDDRKSVVSRARKVERKDKRKAYAFLEMAAISRTARDLRENCIIEKAEDQE